MHIFTSVKSKGIDFLMDYWHSENMITDQQVFDQKRKSQILKTLAQTLIDGYGNAKISYFEMKEAATYILDHFDDIKEMKDMLYFLENLSLYWKIFKNIFTLEQQEKVKSQEEQVIKKLSQYIKSSSSR